MAPGTGSNKDKAIERLHAEIRRRDERIRSELESHRKSQQELFFQTHRKLFDGYEERIRDLVDANRQLATRLSDRENEILILRGSNAARGSCDAPPPDAALDHSIMLAFLRSYQDLVERRLPLGTRRRVLYDRLLAQAQFLAGTRGGRRRSPASGGSPAAGAPPPRLSREELLGEGSPRGAAGKPVDVLFVNHEETRTGAPKILLDVARSCLGERECVVLSLRRGSAHEEFSRAFPRLLCAADIRPDLNEIDKATAILKALRPRVVYANSICSFVYAYAARQLGLRTLLHVHELEGGISQTLGFQEKNLARMADVFLAVSTPVRDLLVRRYRCPAERVKLTYEFVDPSEISGKLSAAPPRELRRDAGGAGETITVVGVGAFTYRKGVDMFIRLAADLKHRGADLHFVWVGGEAGPLNPLRNLRQSFAHVFTHVEETSNPYPYVAHADILLLPSREDPFPLVVLEALSLGKPVIAFRGSGGAHEAIGDHGLVVDPLDYDALRSSFAAFLGGFVKRPPPTAASPARIAPFVKGAVLPGIRGILEGALHG